MEDGDGGERRRVAERQKGGGSPSSSFPALVGTESELVLSAVAPLGVTYNQNYSPADMRERYNEATTTTTTTTLQQSGSLSDRQKLIFDCRNGAIKSGDRCQAFHYFDEAGEANLSGAFSEDKCVNYEERPQMMETQQQQLTSKVWSAAKPAAILDDDLSYMMERYLDGGGNHQTPDEVQPSPGQQSTDSGFISDASQQNILTFHDQAMSDGANFQGANYDAASFYNGFGNYFEAGNEGCPVHQGQQQGQGYFDTRQLQCLCSNDTPQVAMPMTQPWDSDSLNNDDLSQIVDQVLSSIDPHFCDPSWTSQTSSSPTPTSMPTKSEDQKGIVSGCKVDLCDNCGNIFSLTGSESQADSCKCCGHFIQRDNEQENQG